jgi:hypothetical protein
MTSELGPPDSRMASSSQAPSSCPVHVFNPQGIGHVPSTFRWNPLDGCQDPAVAIRRADAFANADSQRGVEDASFWAAKASDYLRAYFHAAALAGMDLRHVARWVSGLGQGEAEAILETAPGAARHLAEMASSLRRWTHHDH